MATPQAILIFIQSVSNFLPFIAIWHANSLHYYMIHDTTKILPYPPGGYEIFNKHVNILLEMTAHTLSGDKVSPKKGTNFLWVPAYSPEPPKSNGVLHLVLLDSF